MKKLNTSSIINVIFLAGILIMINVIGIRVFTRFDFTSAKMYSLSKASKDAVSSVEDKILVKAYFSPNLPGNFAAIERYLRDMLEDYRAYSRGHLDYEFINPGDEQALEQEAQSFQIPPRRFRTIANDKVEVVKGYTGVVFIYGDKKESIPVIDQIDNLEYEITSLIKRITVDRRITLGVASTGTEQNQQTMQSLYEALGRNYDVRPVNLDEAIDPNIDGLMVMSPRDPFTDWNLFNLDQYIVGGGRTIMLMNWYMADIQQNQQAMPINLNINGLLQNYGIGLGEDLLSDAECRQVGMQTQQGMFRMTTPVDFPYFPTIITFNPEHVITRDLQKIQMYYPSSVDTTFAASLGYESEVLLYSSKYASRDTGPFVMLDPLRKRTEKDYPEQFIPVAGIVKGAFTSFFAESGPPEMNNNNEPYDGPFKEAADEETRLILVGDGHLGVDGFIDRDSMIFMQNAIDWLTQSEELIAIRSKQIPQKPLKEIPPFARKLIKWLNLFGPSILIIILGIVLWQTRRIKKKAMMAAAQ